MELPPLLVACTTCLDFLLKSMCSRGTGRKTLKNPRRILGSFRGVFKARRGRAEARAEPYGV